MPKTLLALTLALVCAFPALAEGFAVVETPVFRERLTGETVPLRFYDDMPSVPCLGLAEYYRLMLGVDMPVENRGDGVYVFTAADGATALVDAREGTLTCADFTRFTNLMGRVVPGMDNQYLDAPAFLRPDGLEYADPEPVTLDFAGHRIPVRAGEADVYLPLATLSDIFTNLSYTYAAWNGEKVYVNSDNRLPPAWQRDPDYGDPIYRRADRAPDMAAFAYDELCFAVDTFYGYPGRAPINDALAKLGLDGALSGYSDASRRCRALLRSENRGEYAAGAALLGALFDDGGHTGFNFLAGYAEKPEFAAFAGDYAEAARDNPADATAYNDRRHRQATIKAMQQKRRAAYGNAHYAERGDTAVIWFDSFMYDFEGWQAYYDGAGPRPEGDQMAHVIDGLNRAAGNPEIRNVVFDISCNTGGSADMVAAIMSLIDDAPTFDVKNLLIRRVARQKYRVDRNFDGAFDAGDAEVRFDFRFGVLTSRFSYSCANLLPALMRDRGMAVLGEPSGGGTCAVETHATPEGLSYQLSSGLGRLVDARGNTIDDGVPVDIPLGEGGDYEGFYDLEGIGAGMNEFYGVEMGN